MSWHTYIEKLLLLWVVYISSNDLKKKFLLCVIWSLAKFLIYYRVVITIVITCAWQATLLHLAYAHPSPATKLLAQHTLTPPTPAQAHLRPRCRRTSDPRAHPVRGRHRPLTFLADALALQLHVLTAGVLRRRHTLLLRAAHRHLPLLAAPLGPVGLGRRRPHRLGLVRAQRVVPQHDLRLLALGLPHEDCRAGVQAALLPEGLLGFGLQGFRGDRPMPGSRRAVVR